MRHRVDWQLGSPRPGSGHAGELDLGHGVLGGMGCLLGTAVRLQYGALCTVEPTVPTSGNEHLCALHKVFLSYALICCALEPRFFLRVLSGLTSP